MAFNKAQFKSLIERVLKANDLYSEAAVNLLLGTAAQESMFGTYIKQIKGPAQGVFQVEPATFRSLVKQYGKRFEYITGAEPEEMEYNLALAILMARLKYLSIKEALPAANDLPGLANYWKKYYNTYAGKGTVQQFIANYHKYVGEVG